MVNCTVTSSSDDDDDVTSPPPLDMNASSSVLSLLIRDSNVPPPAAAAAIVVGCGWLYTLAIGERVPYPTLFPWERFYNPPVSNVEATKLNERMM
jgi:hypothetical protein